MYRYLFGPLVFLKQLGIQDDEELKEVEDDVHTGHVLVTRVEGANCEFSKNLICLGGERSGRLIWHSKGNSEWSILVLRLLGTSPSCLSEAASYFGIGG